MQAIRRGDGAMGRKGDGAKGRSFIIRQNFISLSKKNMNLIKTHKELEVYKFEYIDEIKCNLRYDK